MGGVTTIEGYLVLGYYLVTMCYIVVYTFFLNNRERLTLFLCLNKHSFIHNEEVSFQV